MYLTLVAQDGAQRLISVDTLLSISFTVDARRGPLWLVHTNKQERIVGSGTPQDFFRRYAAAIRQMDLLPKPLT